jgi:putative tricarboxylic transport membrane protein
MIEIIFILLLATVAGLFVGLIPGIGSSVLMLSALPFLYFLSPEICIIFYAVGIQSSQFSGSVSAINFGIMGELTSYPALKERHYILKNNLQKTALKFTALGSLLTCIIPIIFLYPLSRWFQQHSLIMRSDFTLCVMLIIILFSVLYKNNSKIINLFLICIGILISHIGVTSQGSAQREFLTFNQSFLFGGIPMISILGGLIAIPLIIKCIKWNKKISIIKSKITEKKIRFPFISCFRGGLLGLFTGLIPAIGTQIGSNLAWRVEKIFFPKNTHESVMARLTSAESANNGSQITVLIPLLVIGVAIVPSEMILLSLLETKSWVPGKLSWNLLGFNFYSWLMITLIISSIICYLICYSFIGIISPWIKKNFDMISKFCILIMTVSVFYAGSLVESRLFFICCFLIFSTIGIFLKKIDFIPLVVGYFIGDILLDTILILSFIYG